MSDYPRHDLQNRILGRQLAVAGSSIAWLITIAASLIGLGFCTYFWAITYNLLPMSPSLGKDPKQALSACMILTVIAIYLCVMLFIYLKEHVPPNLREIERLSVQLKQY